MERCWNPDPTKRPNIQKIKIILENWIRNPTYNIVDESIITEAYEPYESDQIKHSQAIYTSRLLNPYTKNLFTSKSQSLIWNLNDEIVQKDFDDVYGEG